MFYTPVDGTRAIGDSGRHEINLSAFFRLEKHGFFWLNKKNRTNTYVSWKYLFLKYNLTYFKDDFFKTILLFQGQKKKIKKNNKKYFVHSLYIYRCWGSWVLFIMASLDSPWGANNPLGWKMRSQGNVSWLEKSLWWQKKKKKKKKNSVNRPAEFCPTPIFGVIFISLSRA